MSVITSFQFWHFQPYPEEIVSEYLKNIPAKAKQAPVKQGKIGQLFISFLLVKIFYASVRDTSLCTCK